MVKKVSETLLPKIIRPSNRTSWIAGQNTENSPQRLLQFDTADSTTTNWLTDRVNCIAIRNPAGAPWCYFKIAFGPDISAGPVTVSVRVFSDTPRKVWIEYDSTDPGVLVVKGNPGAFKRSATVDLPRASWTECRFVLPDMRCTQRINGGDFRVVCSQRSKKCFYLQWVKLILDRNAAPAIGHSQSIACMDAAIQTLAFKYRAKPEVSIIIPFLDRKEFTQQCLLHLYHKTEGVYELILVDDGSSSGAREALESIPGIRLVSNAKNLGYAAACNKGAKIARGSYLVFLNNDIIPESNWLGELVACITRNPNAGVIGSKLIYPGTNSVQHAGVFLNSLGLTYHRTGFVLDTRCLLMMNSLCHL